MQSGYDNWHNLQGIVQSDGQDLWFDHNPIYGIRCRYLLFRRNSVHGISCNPGLYFDERLPKHNIDHGYQILPVPNPEQLYGIRYSWCSGLACCVKVLARTDNPLYGMIDNL